MTDATKLYKGAAALRKGIAMFMWLGDVEAALKEVPDLERTLNDLRNEVTLAATEVDRTKTELRILRGEHSGAKAQAEKIIGDAKEEVAARLTTADLAATEMISAAEAELATLRKTIEKESADHLEEMQEYVEVHIRTKKRVDELNAELAAIKARF